MSEHLERVAAAMDADFVGVTGEHPSLVGWNGANYTGIVTDTEEARELGFTGYSLEQGLTIYFRTAAFSNARPDPNDVITLATKTYRVTRTETASDGLSFSVDCTEVTR